ncbi:FG-GAP repeat protein [bacterium]|nr:FG-GAP repeat protein [bacterium]
MSVSRTLSRFAALAVCLAACLPAFPGGPDPAFVIRAVLTEPKPTMVSHFGNSVSIGDGQLVVGACWASVGAKERAGAAYLFDLGGAYKGALASATPRPNACFAGDPFTTNAAAMNGADAIVGEWTGAGGGRVFVFAPDGARLAVTCPDARPGLQFGCSVAGDGEGFLVGAYACGAWLFDPRGRPLATYVPTRGVSKCFGMSVSLKGPVVVVTQDHIAVGDTPDAGMAFLFDRAGRPIAELRAPAPETGSAFGVCSATDSEIIAVGAPSAKVAGFTSAGAVYLFSARDGSFLRTLLPPLPTTGGHFGTSVSIDKGRVLVGAPGTQAAGIPGAGACYLFDAEGRAIAEFADPQPTLNSGFGRSVDIRGNYVAIGEVAANIGDAEGAGKVILFEETAR